MKKLNGVIPPLITPFDKYGNLDLNNLQKLVEYLSPHVDGLFICGSYGCGAMMTVEERKKVAETVKKAAAPGTTIVVHAGTTTTKDTIELTRHAADIGCDAAAAVGPYYFKYNDDSLVKFYSDVLKSVHHEIPFYAYHNPNFQGYETNIEVFKALKNDGLSGIKDATFDIMKYGLYASELMDDHFDVALGTEAIWVAAHSLGCQAFIPGIGNVLPELCKQMWNLSMKGNDKEALDLQFKINKIREIMYIARSTQLAVYAIAEIRGIITAYPRAPFIPATAQEKESIHKALVELGAI